MYLSLTLVIGVIGLNVVSSTNWALNRPSYSSSVFWGQTPNKGNDGNRNNHQHTGLNNPSWWCVQLDTVMKISSIYIYNRWDHTYWRMQGFEIRVSDKEHCSGSNFWRARLCHRDTQGKKEVYGVSSCNQGGEFSGRFVYVSIPRNEYLHMREFELYGAAKYTNIALGRTSVESSIYSGLVASHGNDGNMATINHTHKDNPSWWCVILDTVYNFMHIVVYNRDNEVANRIDGFEIRVQDVGACNAAAFRSARICHKDTTGTKHVYTIDGCNKGGSFSGRFVYINTAGSQYLHVRELQISGTVKYTNRALKQPSVESSIYGNLVASRSNDGDMGTYAQTQQDNPSWWCVKLDNIYNFLNIVVYNRENSARLKEFEIRVQDFGACNAANFKSAKMCHKDTTGTKDVYTIDGCNKGGDFSGRYVYINTAGSLILHMRELQVYGTVKYTSNLALNQPSVESSIYDNEVASKSNDGDMGTMAHTKQDNPSWWCVKLDNIYNFINIVVYNRAGGTSIRLKEFEIRVQDFGACNAETFKSARICHKDSTGDKQIYTIDGCNKGGDFSGRYVYINTAGSQYLHVRELQVYGIVKGILPNIASNTYVMQSSTNGHSAAKLAVDDDLKTCSLTNVGAVSWLCVELNGQNALDSIRLTQKYDAKISGYEIRLDTHDDCYPDGYKLAELCYKDTSGADAIQQCNQNGVLFSARSIYIGVANSAFNLCDINVLPVIGTSCSLS